MKVWYVRLVITLIFWGVIFYLLRNSFESLPTLEEITTAIEGNANPALLALGGGFFLCAMFARVSRFYFMMHAIFPLTRSHAAAIFCWSFFLGAISPFRAGESVRILWARQHGVDVTGTTAIWLVERAADLYAITTISLCSAMVVFKFLSMGPGLALGGILLVLPVLLLYFLTRDPVLVRIPLLGRLPSTIASRISFMRSYRLLIGLALQTCVIWLLMGLMFYFSYGAFVENLSMLGAAFLLGVVNLSFLLAFLPGNLVGYQSAAVFALGLLGVTPTIGLAASIVVYAITFMVILVLGAIARGQLAMDKPRQNLDSKPVPSQGL